MDAFEQKLQVIKEKKKYQVKARKPLQKKTYNEDEDDNADFYRNLMRNGAGAPSPPTKFPQIKENHLHG